MPHAVSFPQLGLIIAQTRDRRNRLSGIKLAALQEGLEKVYHKARQLRGKAHLLCFLAGPVRLMCVCVHMCVCEFMYVCVCLYVCVFVSLCMCACL